MFPTQARSLRPAGGALLAGLLLGSCGAPAEPAPEPPAGGRGGPSAPAVVTSAQDETATDERAQAAIELVRTGDYRGARELLGELLLEQELATAREWLDQGSPEDALVAVDQALELDRDDRDAVALKAHASFALGEKAIAGGGPGPLVIGAFEDALRFHRRGGDDVNALLGAARAALRLQRYGEARELANRAIAQLDAAGVEPLVAGDGREPSPPGTPVEAGAPLVVAVTPERVLAEAAYRLFVEARQAEPEAATTQERFAAAEDALDRLLGRDQDAWTWQTLVDLYLWNEDLASARSQAENGLDREPRDVGLIDRLANVAHGQGGPAEVAGAFTAFNERHPGVARGLWYEAQGRFDQATAVVVPLVAAAITGEATERPADAERVPALYREAEELLRRCRELDAEYASACLGYEALTRGGLGWFLFAEGELEAATEAFLSMQEVYEGGIGVELEGSLLSGLQGIAQVGGAYNDRGDWRAAGEAFATLAALDRSRSTWSNNQGFFFRDAAVELEALGRELCAAAREGRRDEELLAALAERTDVDLRGVEVANAAELMRRASNAAMDEARALMQRSWEGYQLAAELAPDDVRIVNDAGLVQVYYLHAELERAEELLLRAAEMGAEQMAAADAEGLDDDARFEVANAWGDAYQNLGVLYANHRDDAEAALRYFERAIEIGPLQRPLLTNFWIPFLKGERAPEEVPDDVRLKTWAQPCED